jgi:hypothetical protein
MLVDGNIGGTVDGTEGGDLDVLNEQVEAAQRAGTRSCRCCSRLGSRPPCRSVRRSRWPSRGTR